MAGAGARAGVCATAGSWTSLRKVEVTGLLEAGRVGGLGYAAPILLSQGSAKAGLGRPHGRGVGQGAGGRRCEGGPTAPRPPHPPPFCRE